MINALNFHKKALVGAFKTKVLLFVILIYFTLSYWTLRSKVKYPRMVSFLYNLYGYFAFYKGSIWQNSPSFSSGFFARLTHSKWQEFAVFASGFYRTLQGVAVAKNTTAVILSDSEKSTCKDGTALSFWAECISTKRKIHALNMQILTLNLWILRLRSVWQVKSVWQIHTFAWIFSSKTLFFMATPRYFCKNGSLMTKIYKIA